MPRDTDDTSRGKCILRYAVFPSQDALPSRWRSLVESAQLASKGSYAPYSSFFVGAALLLSNGIVVRGANQENAAYPSGLCAERVALFTARAQYPGERIVALAIAARTEEGWVESPVAPCGACRQVLQEFCPAEGPPVVVLLSSASRVVLVEDARELLPLSFSLPL